MFALETIPKNGYICENKTHRPPYPRSEKAAIEQEYPHNQEGCWLCFDATRRYDQYGRYINHAPERMANARLANPVLFNGKLRLGVVAVREITMGEEISYDYGVRGEEWLPCAGINSKQSYILA